MFLSFFFKAVYVGIFRDSSVIAFHKFDAAYLHYLEPKVVDFTSGRSKYCGSSWGCKWSALLLWDHVSLQVLHRWLISQKQWTIFSLIVVHEDLRDRYAYESLYEARTYLWKQNWALVCPPSLTCQRTSYYRSVTFRNSNQSMVEWKLYKDPLWSQKATFSASFLIQRSIDWLFYIFLAVCFLKFNLSSIVASRSSVVWDIGSCDSSHVNAGSSVPLFSS